jgi:hypothetical protein
MIFDPAFDDGRAAKFASELWQQTRMPSIGPHSAALSMLLACLLNHDPNTPAIDVNFRFSGRRPAAGIQVAG